jgi:hypothetical protein
MTSSSHFDSVIFSLNPYRQQDRRSGRVVTELFLAQPDSLRCGACVWIFGAIFQPLERWGFLLASVGYKLVELIPTHPPQYVYVYVM